MVGRRERSSRVALVAMGAALAACSSGAVDERSAEAELLRRVEEGDLPVDTRRLACDDDGGDCGIGLSVGDVDYVVWGPGPAGQDPAVRISAGTAGYRDVSTVAGFGADWVLLADDAAGTVLLVGRASLRRPASAAEALSRESTVCGTPLQSVLDSFDECDDGELTWEVKVDDPPPPNGDAPDLSGDSTLHSRPTDETLAGLLDGTIDHPSAHPTADAALGSSGPSDVVLNEYELFRLGYRVRSRSDDAVVGEWVRQSWRRGSPWVEQFVEPFGVERLADGVWWITRTGPVVFELLGEGEDGRSAADAAWTGCCDAVVIDNGP